MAQQLEHSRLIGGGMVLVPPVSNIGNPYAALMQNWRVDRAGGIKTRRGVAVEGAPGGNIHTLYRVGTNRFGGVGGSLQLGASLGTTVDSGFDGVPIGIASASDWTWIMNRAKQRKVEGTTAHNWGIAAPASACSAAVGAETSLLVSEFDSADAWEAVYYDGTTETIEPAGVKTYDASNKQSGTHSTRLECNPPGKYALRKTFASTDWGFAGLQENTDVFYVWIYASNRDSVASVTITATDSAGNTAYATLPGSALSPESFSWKLVALHRRLDPAAVAASNPEYQAALQRQSAAQEAGNMVEFEAARQSAETLFSDILARTPAFREPNLQEIFDWSAVTGLRFEFDISESCDVHLDLAEWYGSRGTMSGEYTFFVTFANDYGHESNPGPGSESIVVQNRKIDLTSLPTSADPQVTQKHIYGIGNALDRPLRFKTVAAGVASTTIDVALDTVQDLAIEMPTRNGLPPAARGCVLHLGRMIAYDSDAHPSRTWWTEVAKPYAFYGADDDEVGDWRDNGDASERILYAVSRGNVLYLYKERSIWRVVGDIATNLPEEAAARVASVGPRAVAHGPGYEVMGTEEGVGIFSGDAYRDISGPLKPIFQGEATELPGGITVSGWNRATASASCIAYSNGRVYFSYPEGAASAPTATVVYDEASQVWSLYRLGASLASTGFSALYHEGTGNGLVGGVSGSVVEVETGATDGGGSIPVLYQSPELDQGQPDVEKRYVEIAVAYRTAEPAQAASALTLKVITAEGVETSVGSLSSATRTRTAFPLGVNGEGILSRGLSYRLEGAVSSTCTVEALDLYWATEGRRRTSYDSEMLTFCFTQDVQGFDLVMSSTGAVTWAVDTDTSGTVSQVATGTLTSTADARANRKITLTGVTGRVVRLRMWAAAGVNFRLYSVKARLRELGEAIDAGSTWKSTQRAPGDLFEKAWLFRRWSIDSDMAGALTFTALTDLHQRNIQSRFTATVNTESTTTGRRTIEADFSPNVKGFLKELTLGGANAATLFGLKVYVKPMGWGDGAWRWVEIPVRKGEDIARCVEVPIG